MFRTFASAMSSRTFVHRKSKRRENSP